MFKFIKALFAEDTAQTKAPKKNPKNTNGAISSEITDKIEKASSIFIINARNLTVEKDTKLRKSFREAKVDYKVYRGDMLKTALIGTKFQPLINYFNNIVSAAFCYDDPYAAAVVIDEYISNDEGINFVAAMINDTIFDGTNIDELKKLTEKQVLQKQAENYQYLSGSQQRAVKGTLYLRFVCALKHYAEEKI